MDFSNDLFVSSMKVAVLAAWFLFAGAFLFRKSPHRENTKEEKRSSEALSGVFLQGVGFVVIWVFPRPVSLRLLPSVPALDTALMLLAPVIAFLSVWLVMVAIRTLGKQWAVNARLVEAHILVTSGPFSLMRHPIYAGMLGMLMATGSVNTVWWGVLLACSFFLAGLVIRIRVEERLLLEAFGSAFEEYRRRVPAVIPSILRSR